MINKELLEILACPECKCALRPEGEEEQELVCTGCRKKYPVKEGIPIMIPAKAEPAGAD